MRPSTLVVLLGVCAASRCLRDSVEELLAEAFKTVQISDGTIENLSEAINALFVSSGNRTSEHVKEHKKIEKFFAPHCNQLDELFKETTSYIRDVLTFYKDLIVDLQKLVKGAPNGMVTKSILGVKMTKKYLRNLQSTATELAARQSQLRRRESSLLAEQDSLIRRECDFYQHRLTKNVEHLAPSAEGNFKEAALGYALFENSVANLHCTFTGAINSTENIFVSRLLEFDNGPINKLISLTKTFDLEAYHALIAELKVAMRNFHERYRISSISENLVVALTNRRVFNRRIVAEQFAENIANNCSFETLNAANMIKDTVRSTIKSVLLAKNSAVDSLISVAAEPQSVKAAIVESWAEGAVDRVADALFAAVATEMGEGVVMHSKCNPDAIESLKQSIIQTHRETHSRFAAAKERRETFVASAVTADIQTVIRALAFDATAANRHDHSIVEAVARELISEISREPSASSATKALDAKLKEQRVTLGRLERILSEQRAAHTNALESIVTAEVSVSVYETQLESFLPPAGVAMDTKVTKKWERAIASHAAVITGLDQAVSLAITTLMSTVRAAGEVTAVKSRIRAIEHAITAVQSTRS